MLSIINLEMYQLLFDNLLVGVSFIDKDFNIVIVNKKHAENFNKKPDKFIGKKCYQEFEKQDNVCMHCPGKIAMETGKFAECKSKGVRDDGSEFFVHIKAIPLFFEDKIIGFMEMVEDITKIQKAETRFKTIFENARDGILLADTNTKKFILANQAMCDMLGYSNDEILTLSVNEIHPEKDLPYVIEQFAKQVNKEITLAENIPLLTKNNIIIYADVNSVPVELEGNKYLMGMFRDVTERKKLEEEKILFNEEKLQNEKMQAIGRLAGGIAHDFNNILTAIIGTADLIMTENKNLTYYNDLKEIKDSGNRAAALTAQLLAFSRRQPINPRLSDLNEIISHSLKMINRIIGENIELNFIAGKNTKLVHVDPSQIEQIFINLAVNAKDAMPLGGKLIIKTDLQIFGNEICKYHKKIHSGEYVLLKIEDTGCGIAQDDLEHIFEPFYTTKQFGQGTGLGLSIIYGIVEQSNGLIKVESELEKGTSFSILLPAVREKSSEVDKTKNDFMNLSGTETILLVEDEKYLIKLVTRQLKKQGYTVLSASDGVEALEIARKEQFDLLLTDVIMPKMNGKELYDNINKMYPEIKVIFMSGYTYEVIKIHGVEAAGGGFIQKPYDPHELLCKVREILDK